MSEPIDALAKYMQLKVELQRPPSSREFYRAYPKRQLSTLFAGGKAYSKLQQLAGDAPNDFSSPKSSLHDIIVRWGKLARGSLHEFGRLPIQDDWNRGHLRPSVSGINRSHAVKWSQLPRLFAEEFSDDPGWTDVISAISQDPLPQTKTAIEPEACFVYLMRDLRNRSYKIGIALDPWTRERTLQSEQPKIERIACKRYVNRKMALAIEKALHGIYGHKKKRGEWFNLDAEDLKELKATLDDSIS